MLASEMDITEPTGSQKVNTTGQTGQDLESPVYKVHSPSSGPSASSLNPPPRYKTLGSVPALGASLVPVMI